MMSPVSADTDEVSHTKAFIPLRPEYACATVTVLICDSPFFVTRFFISCCISGISFSNSFFNSVMSKVPIY